MALVGRYNSLQVVKHTDFGVYLDGGAEGEILLPRRYLPKEEPHEVGDWLNVFVYLDSEDRLLATTAKPKVQVGEFASLKVVQVNAIGVFLDWGLPKDLLLPFSEEKRQLAVGDYVVVHVFLDHRTRRITASAKLDRYLDKAPPPYVPGQAVSLLVTGKTDLGFNAIIENRHWGLIHKNEVFKFLRGGSQEQGYIREVRADGKVSLSLQPPGVQASDGLHRQILERVQAAGGSLAVCDKSDPQLIAQLFGVSKGNFKKAIGALYKEGKLVILNDKIELP
ncbi:S1 RNA-binding domain-containing protein [Pseudomonas typographi]|uniref:GntR family transcriptional regulator n=1 Tax=Pseudomonas typographi TaxID=2715964 RepID=A0ABR7Z473_9PSED|nr:S1-like domain-containing RNA-binding protein [Pseudomonas typographi]MBD1552742.1 GntR family transcriptional regulator [Pseudomonas typographi]MBD1588223.1 GntR family transcriptional regulator [Pseudomonas typographi]MBD1600194.1 GntR family transcriptional regulator [Pseudomonas typographi]